MILRPATMADAVLLFEWRNDPMTIKSLSHPTLVSWEEHVQWMVHRVTEPHFYIAEESGLVIGTGRLDACYEISVTVSPEHRGKGYAPLLIAQVTERAGGTSVWARVVPGNQASLHAFDQAGFRQAAR